MQNCSSDNGALEQNLDSIFLQSVIDVTPWKKVSLAPGPVIDYMLR